MGTQEFLLARIEALEKEVKNLNSDMNLHLSTLEAIIRDQKLTDVIKGLDPTNPILQHLTL